MRGGRSPRLRAVALGAAAALALGACAGGPAAPSSFRTTSVSKAPSEWGGMKSVLSRAAAAREGKDAATLRAMFPEVLASARRMLLMKPASDLARQDVGRFLDARAAFSDEVNALGRAQAGTDDAALFSASKSLEDSFWNWYDAYRGKPSEGAV